MRTRFSVARCCCGPPPEPTCEIDSDDFERADDADIDADSPCGWTEQSGSTLGIVSGEVTGAGTAICDHVKTNLPGTIKLVGSIRFTATDGQVRVIYQWTDSSNYACVEWVHQATTLRGRVITRQSGSETVRATFSLTHTRDSDELFDFCITWDAVSSPNWQVKSMLASTTDATFALPGAVSFSMSPILEETGTTGFYLNGNCYLQSFELWKTSQDSILCSDCYGCHIGEVYDEFSSGDVIWVAGQPQFTGMWEQLFPLPDRIFRIADGTLQSGVEGGNAYRCWKKDAFEGFSVLAQIKLVDFTVGLSDTIYFHLSMAISTSPIGLVMQRVSTGGSMQWRWIAFRGSNATVTSITPAVDDVLKIMAVRTANTDEYALEWFVNGTSVKTATATITGWDTTVADNIWVGGYGQQEWDDFYFLSNATVS